MNEIYSFDLTAEQAYIIKKALEHFNCGEEIEDEVDFLVELFS